MYKDQRHSFKDSLRKPVTKLFPSDSHCIVLVPSLDEVWQPTDITLRGVASSVPRNAYKPMIDLLLFMLVTQ